MLVLIEVRGSRSPGSSTCRDRSRTLPNARTARHGSASRSRKRQRS